MMSAADALMAAVLAPRCAACAAPLGSPIAGPVCPLCWASIAPLPAPLCRTCGDPLPSWRVISSALETCPRCRRLGTTIDRGCSAGDYQGRLRDIIHAFKYEGRRSLAARLGSLMRSAGAELLQDADCVVPVPMHALRRMRRGFNHACDLARTFDTPFVPALWRMRATVPQTGLTAKARRANVGRAFRVSPLLGEVTRRTYIEKRVVVLVDDVRTTGATLEACATVLKTAGAREVRALTAARAAPPGSSR